MKTNLIVTFLALSPLFCYVILSSCASQQASYGPIKRDATAVRPYAAVPVNASDSVLIERARYMMNIVLAANTKAIPCTCDLNTPISKTHN